MKTSSLLENDVALDERADRAPTSGAWLNCDRFDLACVALERGDFVSAVAEARACVEDNNHHPRAHYVAGVALIWLGRHDEGEEALLTAVEQDPLLPAAHRALASFYGTHRKDFFLHGRHRVLEMKAIEALRE